MSETEHFRLFLAITPDDRVLDVVKEKADELRRRLDAPGIRWESRSKWHVTLRFLGDVPSGDLQELCAAVEAVCTERKSFSARVAGMGAFPSLKRPRVVWVGLDSEGEHLSDLHRALSAATDQFSAKPDEKRYRPHLTLARIRTEDRRVLAKVEPAVQPFAGVEFGFWEMDAVELWRSVLQPGGSQYELMRRVPLKT